MSEKTENTDVKNDETSEESSTKEELETESEDLTSEENNEEENQEKSSLHKRVDELTDDNRRQKALLEQLMVLGMNRGTGETVQATKVDEDESDIDPAVAKRLRSMEQRQTQQVQGMLGGVLEEMDRTAILSSPKAKLYNKYQQEVESFRQTMGAQGRFFKREEALANILLNKGLFGEEKSTQKKVMKQKITPGGETNKGTTLKKKDEKTLSLKERLAGKSF